MNNISSRTVSFDALPALLVASFLVACGDNIGTSDADKVDFTISGTVTSATLSQEPVTLKVVTTGDVRTMEVSKTNPGSWAFGGLADGRTYTISVDSPPAHEQCAPQNASVTIHGSDVLSVVFDCTPITTNTADVEVPPISFPSGGFVLHLTYSNALFSATPYDQKITVISASMPVSLNQPITEGSAYQVTIDEPAIISYTSPVAHCLIQNPASGLLTVAPTTLAINVQCSNTGRFLYAAAGNLGALSSTPQQGFIQANGINFVTGALNPYIAPPPAKTKCPPPPGSGYTCSLNVVQTQYFPGPLSIVPQTLSNPMAFGYAVDYGLDPVSQTYAISQYGIDTGTGVVTPLTPAYVPMTVQPWDQAVSFDASGKYAYVTQNKVLKGGPKGATPIGNLIFSYPIGTDGTLGTSAQYPADNSPCQYTNSYTQVQGCLSTTVGNPVVNGNYAYQVSAKGPPMGSLTTYKVDASSGALLQQGNQLLFDMDSAQYLSIQSIGKATYGFLLANESCAYRQNPNTMPCNSKQPGVLGFKIDASTGLPSPITTTIAKDPGVAGAPGVFSPLLVDKSGNYAFVINVQASSVTVYRIDQTDGSLSVATGSPFQPGGYTTNPVNMALDPSGQFLYVVFSVSATIAAYSINLPDLNLPDAQQPDALTLIGIYPIQGAPNTGTQTMEIEPAGKFLYVANQDSISGFFIDPNTGALAPIVGSPFAPPPSPLINNPPAGPVYYTSITIMP